MKKKKMDEHSLEEWLNEHSYQGWENYETWNVARWIDKDQELLGTVHDRGRENKEVADFADAIRDLILDMAPELEEASLYSELLFSALDEVNWFELAQAYLKEIEEMDKV